MMLMPKRPTKQHLHPWAIYHIKCTPAKLVGIVMINRLPMWRSSKRSRNTMFRRTSAAD
jgi:hypothetical protein